MKRLLYLTLGALALCSLPARVLAAPAHDDGVHKSEVVFVSPVVVGSTTIAPGSYKAECITVDGHHYIVIKSAEKGELARVSCEPVDLGRKVETSQFGLKKRADGAFVLTEIRVKGETISHHVSADSGQ